MPILEKRKELVDDRTLHQFGPDRCDAGGAGELLRPAEDFGEESLLLGPDHVPLLRVDAVRFPLRNDRDDRQGSSRSFREIYGLLEGPLTSFGPVNRYRQRAKGHERPWYDRDYSD